MCAAWVAWCCLWYGLPSASEWCLAEKSWLRTGWWFLRLIRDDNPTPLSTVISGISSMLLESPCFSISLSLPSTHYQASSNSFLIFMILTWVYSFAWFFLTCPLASIFRLFTCALRYVGMQLLHRLVLPAKLETNIDPKYCMTHYFVELCLAWVAKWCRSTRYSHSFHVIQNTNYTPFFRLAKW